MAGSYVDSGYVEVGYVEGDSIIPIDIGDSTKLDFVISKNTLTESDLIAEVQKSIEGMAVLFIPENNKISLVTKNGSISFLGSSDEIAERITNIENFIQNIGDNLDVSVSMNAPDGTLIASPTVVKDGATFTYTVPTEVSGAEYSVVIDITSCYDCETV